MTDPLMLPQSQESEYGLIASILISPDKVLSEIVGKLRHEHFHIPAHAVIYRTLSDMWTASKKIDIILLTEELARKGMLDVAGGAAFVTGFLGAMPTLAHVGQYVEIIIEKHVLRQIIAKGNEYAARAYEEQNDPKGLLGQFAGDLGAIGAQSHKELKPWRDYVMERFGRYEQEFETGELEDPNQIPTGIAMLDKMSPLKLGSMVVIAAERKAGKSILAITLMLNMCAKGMVVYFSLEDKTEQIVDRAFANETKIPTSKRGPDFTDNDFNKAMSGAARLMDKRIIVRDDLFDLGAIVAFIKQAKTQNPDMVAAIIDYGQLVRADQKKGMNREQVIAEISRTLRLISIELSIAVIVLSQLNKDGDTRESKSLEQDCTALWKVVKVYKETKRKDDVPEEEAGKRIIVIPFQRNGESNVGFPVAFLGEIARIESLAPEYYQDR